MHVICEEAFIDVNNKISCKSINEKKQPQFADEMWPISVICHRILLTLSVVLVFLVNECLSKRMQRGEKVEKNRTFVPLINWSWSKWKPKWYLDKHLIQQNKYSYVYCIYSISIVGNCYFQWNKHRLTKFWVTYFVRLTNTVSHVQFFLTITKWYGTNSWNTGKLYFGNKYMVRWAFKMGGYVGNKHNF